MTTSFIDVTHEDIIEMEKTESLVNWNNYFDNIKDKLGARKESFEQIFDHLIDLEHPPVIIETGTYREQDNYTGDGCSTLLFDKFVDCFGGDLYSVDIDPKACELAESAVKHAEIIESDSVEFLGSLWGPCDLLYLDSYNIENWMDDWAPAAHHLKEMFAAKNIIKTGTLIVVDDNIIHQGKRMGKGRLIYELMDSLGIEPLFDLYQIGWIWEELP